MRSDDVLMWFRVEGRRWPSRAARYVLGGVAAGVAFGLLRHSVIAGLIFGSAFVILLPLIVERELRRSERR
jgi:predicted lipid-binding transport protein (Tim44 family)